MNTGVINVEHLDPSNYELNRDYARRAALVFRLLAALSLCLLIFIGLALYFGNYANAFMFFAIGVLASASLLILKKTKSPTISGNWLLAIIAFIIFDTVIAVGGEVRAVHAWVVALPVLATILGKRKSGFVWFVLASAMFIVSASLGCVNYASDPASILKILVGHISLMALCGLLTYVSFVYEAYNAESLYFIRSLAARDELTKLFNRRGFGVMADYLLKLTRRSGKTFFLVYMDLDGFKQINDTQGHREGDFALRETAHILKACFRDSDIIGRLGGDEFAAAGIASDPSNIDIIVKRLKESLGERNNKSPKPYKIELSHGVFLDDAHHAVTLSELMVKADKEMYRQKEAKKR